MIRDIRFAARAVLRAPSYAGLVIASLAIGIAAPILAFTIVNAAIFRPLEGVPNQEQLARLGLTSQRGERWSLGATHALYVSLRDDLRTLAMVAAAVPSEVVVSAEEGDPVTLNAEIASPEYFETLQLRPAAGRFFGRDTAAVDDRVVVISHDVWRRIFRLAPDVVGRFMLVNGTPVQIVGITPERFGGLDSDSAGIWLPFRLARLALRRHGEQAAIESAGPVNMQFVARLRAGASHRQLEAAATSVVYRASDGTQDRTSSPDRLSQQMLAIFGPAPTGAVVSRFWRNGVAPEPLELGASVAAAMALPFLVLALACINAGNLVLARATRAMAGWRLLLALGASVPRLLLQPIAEGLLLSIPAGMAGLLLTRWALVFTEPLVPFDLLIDWRVVLFAFATAAATPLLFGVAPVWSVVARARRSTLGHSSQFTTRSRVRMTLLAVQAGLSLALLGTGAQWVRTVQDGFGDGLGEGDRLLVASIDLARLDVRRDDADRYYAEVLRRVRAIPGASQAALLGGIPDLAGGVGPHGQASLWTGTDAPAAPRAGLVAYVTPGVFPTLGLRIVSGRTFTAGEHEGPLRVVVVNQAFVARHLRGSPIGQRVHVRPHDDRGVAAAHADALEVAIVGVVSDAPVRRVDTLPMMFAPVPPIHVPTRTMYIPFSGSAALEAALPPVREAIRGANPRVPFTLAPLDDVRWRRSEPQRFMALAVTTLGGMALLLAAVGLSGAVSYAVERRTREIGVRIAVGATTRSVVRTIAGEAMTIAAIGCGLGAAGAAAIAVVVRSRMYGASAIDPIAYGAAIGVLLSTMLVASVVPALRAARVDPSMTFRAE